ncbi:MAG TPA: TonB-dependent receptor plug domain-containing protein [Sphingobium sp.]|uniref:TonB-dependent receptor n=1 Tax=Sphingobium sp. TaxID=1912891 RepID=UPI002ED16062
MPVVRNIALVTVSIVAMSAPAFAEAQDATHAAKDAVSAPEIVVSARRKDELLQDVPKAVSVVGSDTLNKLKIRTFADVQSTVPGLNLTDDGNGITQTTTLRGISTNIQAGNDATVDFYLNDASIQQDLVFKTLYDIGQIEVLRGPQGTLRGRATPSGSITFTTHQPDLYKIGGYLDGTTTGSSIGANDLQGAVNIPVIEGKLAIRVAGEINDTDLNGVRPAHIAGQDALTGNPFNRTWSERVSVRFEPTDTLQFNVMYQHMVLHAQSYPQTASICLLDPNVPCTGTIVSPRDRLSTVNGAATIEQQLDIVNGRADWHILGQKLSYVGQYAVNVRNNITPQDYAGVVPGGSTTDTEFLHSRSEYQTHEIRLASEERLFGFVDYTLGLFTVNTPTDNLIYYNALNVSVPNRGVRRETSIFGNIILQPFTNFELSGGLRKVIASNDYDNTAGFITDLEAQGKRWRPTIWNVSAKYQFTPSIMGYVSAATASRQGTISVGPTLRSGGALASGVYFAGQPGPAGYGAFLSVLSPFSNLSSEYSHSYEVGLKTTFNGHRGVFNINYFHQDFSNYQFSNYSNIFVGLYTPNPLAPNPYLGPRLDLTGLGANVPVKVDGTEASLGYQFNPDLYLGVDLSYVKSRITGGTVACNPTTAGAKPINDASGNPIVFTCPGIGSATYSSPFTATGHGEYSHAVSGNAVGYLRGLLSVYGATPYNPDVPYNKQKAYALLNMYVGVRAPDGQWDLSFFVKNLTNTQTVLASNTGNTQQVTTFGGAGASPYAQISYTPPRQFGVNLRVAFGSR